MSIQSSAQSTLSTNSKKAISYYLEADNYRVRRQYEQAIELLEAAINKDANFIEAYERLAGIYHIRDQFHEAEINYQQAISLRPNSPKSLNSYLSISQVQVTQEKYDLAKQNVSHYLRIGGQGNRNAKLLMRKINYALIHISNPMKFDPQPLNDNINQFSMQYFPAITADESTLLYTKREGNGPYDDEDIMISAKDESGTWAEPHTISPNINTELNEGTCSISADGRTLVFTSCQGRQGFGSCDLFFSLKTGDDWSVPQNMGSAINSSAWDSQPSLSADGRTIYFVSNRRGGLGGRDIWVSTKKAGQWTSPKNLGKDINTINEEVSPFIHPNGKNLYFSSDGLAGFGGFDIYYSVLDSSKSWKTPVNIGYPINRGTDQMSLIITTDGSKGYYSDSGADNQRLSEIKQFDVPEQIRIKHKSRYVKGIVRDQKSQIPLKSQIQLYDLSSNELVGEVVSDSITGEYLMVLTDGVNYALYVEKKGYVFKSINFDFKQDYTKSLIIDVDLTPISKGAIAVLNNIFFEHDSYDLSKESQLELDRVALFIKTNNVRLEIGGYTDNSGTAIYNLALSEKRAKTVYDYLINEKNIPQNGLVYKGYGQDISVESRQQKMARRIEFRLL